MNWVSKLLVKPPDAKPGEINYSFVDRFTLVHFAIGVGYGMIGLGPLAAFGLALLWELLENPLKVRCSFLFPNATADTWANLTGDVLALSCGWLAHYFFTA